MNRYNKAYLQMQIIQRQTDANEYFPDDRLSDVYILFSLNSNKFG